MNNEQGFTLVEVLVALVILAGGLAVAYQTLGVGLQATSIAEHHRDAAAAAENMLSELGRTVPILDGTTEGDLADGQHWRLQIAPFETAGRGDVPAPMTAHFVTIEIGRQQLAASANLVFQTLMLTPVD